MNTLIDLFKLFKKRGSQDVFVYRTGIRKFKFTYSDLYSLSLKMSSYLLAQGVKSGDKIAIWAPNDPFWAVSYFGIILTGSIVVPIDFASGRKRAETILKLSGAKFIIQSLYKFEKINPQIGLKTVMIEDLRFLLKPIKPIEKLFGSKSSDMVEIVYTSGTTGDPKGVVLAHKNIITNMLQACDHLAMSKKFNFLSVLPLSHMMEQTVGFLVPLYRGDKIIYLRTVKPTAIMQALKEENVAVMLVVPRFLSILKNTIERGLSSKGLLYLTRFKITRKIIAKSIHKKFGKDFEMFFTGGVGLPLDVFSFWKGMGFRVVEGYGLTECSPIISANSFDRQIPGSVGRPLKGIQVKLDNKEILAKGENIFKEYYQSPETTEKAFKNGWFKTGDYGHIDKDGYIFIKGRKKDVIVNASGINIYPDEIENVINKIKGVKESCVIGLEKDEGEEVHAVLILKNKDADPRRIIKTANEKLDPLSQITGFSLWNEFDFPRTTTLKIQKFKVKERLLNENKKTKNDLTADTLISLLMNVCKREENEIKENSILTSDLGLNSLSRLELINYLEQEYRVDLEDTIINQATTVADLRKLLEKRGKTKKQKGLWSWVNNPFGKEIREILDIVLHKPLSYLFVNLESVSLSNLKNVKWPVVFISNHVSYLDQPVIMYSLPRLIRYKTATATREEFFFTEKRTSLLKHILFLYAIVAFNAFLLPQKRGFRKTLSFMGGLIDTGVNILVFPEGTRTRNGKVGPFMQGLGLLAKELQVPIVPIRILGMEKIHPRGSWLPKKGKCKVIFGKPLEFTTETPSEIVEISRKAILNLTAN